jgi:hypothetical protein
MIYPRLIPESFYGKDKNNYYGLAFITISQNLYNDRSIFGREMSLG